VAKSATPPADGRTRAVSVNGAPALTAVPAAGLVSATPTAGVPAAVPRPRISDATTSTPVASYTDGSRASGASESRATSRDLAKRLSREPSRASERVRGLGATPPDQ
jgi:hypothetical protein